MTLKNHFMTKAALAVGGVAIAVLAPAAALAQAPDAQPAAAPQATNVKLVDWIKRACDSPDQWNVRCAQKLHPGDQPEDWNTPKYAPYVNPDGVSIGGLEQPGIVITWNPRMV